MQQFEIEAVSRFDATCQNIRRHITAYADEMISLVRFETQLIELVPYWNVAQ